MSKSNFATDGASYSLSLLTEKHSRPYNPTTKHAMHAGTIAQRLHFLTGQKTRRKNSKSILSLVCHRQPSKNVPCQVTALITRIFNHVMFIYIICFIVCFHWPWKAPLGEWSIKVFIILLFIYLNVNHKCLSRKSMSINGRLEGKQ
jgi:hypothetical protein